MLEAIRLYQFRNYDESRFAFSSGVNGIFGPNGSGKTNIVEAISLLSTGRSFRAATLEEMTKHDCNAFAVGARLTNDGLSTRISLTSDSTNKTAQINSNEYSYFSAVLGAFPTVLFAPRDMSIISASPADRRRFWNIMLSQGSPIYLHHLTRYTRALKQRNILLKKKQPKLLPPWDAQLSHSGFYLIAQRRASLSLLQPLLQKYYEFLSPQAHHIALEYAPSLNVHSLEEYGAALERSVDKDILYQTTNQGPHRDDFALLLDGKLAKTYASEGQKRTCIAALKCSEWELLNQQADTPPLFCIDDCPAHLDETRVKRFIETFTRFPQVLITAPSQTSFPMDVFSQVLSTGELLSY